MNTVLVIGAGLMGSGIAACSAVAGNKTYLFDTDTERTANGANKAKSCINELFTNGLIDQAATDQANNLIVECNDYHLILNEVTLVIEAIIEDLEIKQNLFAELDAAFPASVPLLSNTSGLRITDISMKMAHPERAVTAHFWFPAHLVPLVEVVVGERTDLGLASQVRDTLNDWGKAAVLVKQDLPGQLANRILQAMIREAVNIVEIGLASAEDVDTAIKMGMGIRLPVWGPLEHIEAIGLDLGLKVQTTVLPEIAANQTPSAYLTDMVSRGDLGYKTGKGFYDWSTRNMDEIAATRNQFIILARKFMKEKAR